MGQSKSGGALGGRYGATPKGAVSIASSKQVQSGVPAYPMIDRGGRRGNRIAGEKTRGKRQKPYTSAPAIDPTTQAKVSAVFNSTEQQVGPTAPAPVAGSSVETLQKLKAAREATHGAKQDVREARSDLRAATARGGSGVGEAADKFQQAREARRSAMKERGSARAAYNSAVSATQSQAPQ